MTRVAVTGAAGKTGRAVTAALRARGQDVLALVRRPGTALDGVPQAVVDLDTGEGLQGLAGCSALYLLAPNVHPDEPGLVTRMLEAARTAGVERVVYHSVAQPYAPGMPHHVDKAVAEDVVRRSGLTWTVLQPAAYVQNFVEQLRGADPVLVAPYSAAVRFNLVDLVDVAEAAAVVLTVPGHGGATYELGGPHAVTLADVAAAAADVLGVDVPVRTTSPQEWAAGPGAQLDDGARQRLQAMFAYYDRHGLLAGPLALQALTGRSPATVPDVLRRELTVPES